MPAWDTNSIKLLVGGLVAVLMIVGLLPFSFSLRQKKFIDSKALLCYALLINFAFIGYYGSGIYNEYLNDKLDLKNATKLYSYTNILASIACFTSPVVLMSALKKFLNDVPFFRTLSYFELHRGVVRSVLIVISIKAFVFPTLIGCILVIRQRQYEPQHGYMQTLGYIYPYIISNLFPNCLFGALNVCKMLVQIINTRLRVIADELNYMQSLEQLALQKPYYRMQRFCDLADKLDILAEKYTVICRYSQEYVQLTGVPIICSLLCNLTGITAGFFVQYLAIAETMINSAPYDVLNVLSSSVFLIISLCEVILQSNICNANLKAVRCTGIILQSINLLHADVRFKQSVESFSLLIFSIDYKIKPLGLLEINVALLHSVLSAVASFLLILIQSDLTLRFSLK